MNSNWGTKAGKRPTKIHRMIQSMKDLSSKNIDIFLFGWYAFRGHLGGTTRRIDIRDTLSKVCFQSLEIARKGRSHIKVKHTVLNLLCVQVQDWVFHFNV